MSCSKKDDSKISQTDNTTSEVNYVVTDKKDARLAISDDLPEKDFNGREFRVLTRGNPDFTCRHVEDIIAEEPNGDVINDAVYKRNQLVEERFNTKIVNIAVGDADLGENSAIQALQKSVRAGDDEYDLIISHMINMGIAATSDSFLNWYDVPYINFEKPWWVQSATDELTVYGKSFFALSDLTYNSLDYTYCMYFNKNLLADYNIPSPYESVRNGTWTLDYMQSLVKDIYTDLNANDKRDENDFYGLYTNVYSANVNWLWALDNPITKKSADGIPELIINNPKTSVIIEKLYDLFYNTPGCFVTQNANSEEGTPWNIQYYKSFSSGKSVFATGMFNDAIINYRDLEHDYGIVPYPKYDENQKEYYTMLDGHGPLMGVPMTVTDTEFVGIITEAMSAEAYKHITPAYYDMALKTKYARDDDTAEMLDIILKGRRFDFGYIYDGWKGMAFSLQNLLQAKSKDFASYYAKNEKAALKYYEKILKAYEEYGQ